MSNNKVQNNHVTPPSTAYRTVRNDFVSKLPPVRINTVAGAIAETKKS